MIIHGDVAFMILSTTLVLIMTPGLAFFYGGLVERKNALTIMFQVFIAIGVVSLLWIFGGFSLLNAFGTFPEKLIHSSFLDLKIWYLQWI